ncbi:MAG: spirocyclase AveC family protein [Solirubrobacteraceae bacterium]
MSTGPTHLPGWMKIALGIQQWGLFAGMWALIYFKAIRPRMKTGRFTLDGLMVCSFALMWWSDPLYNYFQVGFSYNAWFVNLGSWVGGIPGWMSPNAARTPQPLIWLPGVYTCAFFLVVLIANAIMRRLYAWRPRLSVPSAWVITFVPMFVVGTFWEAMFMRMGSHSYAGAIRGLALNPGSYYEFPIYQGITASILYTTWGAMRFYRDDQGYSFAERGVTKLRLGPRLGGCGSSPSPARSRRSSSSATTSPTPCSRSRAAPGRTRCSSAPTSPMVSAARGRTPPAPVRASRSPGRTPLHGSGRTGS